MTWEQLYELYSDKIYNFILLLVGKEDLAEDLTHDTFIRANKSLNEFRGDSSYYTWLISIARNIVYDHWRRKRKFIFTSLPDEIIGNHETPDAVIEKNESLVEVYEAVLNLKSSYREVVVLRNIFEFTIRETAEILKWSESKVRTVNHRALKSLEEDLKSSRKGDFPWAKDI